MRRALIGLLVLVVAIPFAAIAAGSWFLNGDAIKARLAEQVRRATGRELTIAGPVRLAWSLSPTIELTDVSFANPPGFSQPHMAQVRRVAAAIALWPLLERRVVIEHMAIVSPSVRLERTADGRTNWDLRPPPAPGTAAPAQPGPPGERFALAVGAIDITDAAIAWAAQTITVPHLAYDPRSGQIDGSVAVAGRTFALAGQTGPIAAAAFPVDLHASGNGIDAALTGTSAAATLTVAAADLTALSPLVGRTLPSVHDVTLSTAIPGPGELRLRSGTAVIGPLTVQNALLTAASPSGPGTFSAAASIGALPLSIAGRLDSLDALLRGPAPVEARLEAPGLAVTAAGTLDATGAADIQLGLQSPDLAASGARAGVRLPAFRALNATARLSLSPGQLELTAIRLTSAQGDLAGVLTFGNASRPSLRGTLTSTSLDLDALTPPPTVPPPAPTPAAPTPGAAPAAQPARVIPDIKLPLAALRSADADLSLAVASLRVAGATYQGVQAHGLLQNGTLSLDPVSTTIGAGTAQGSLHVDAAETPPTLHLIVDAPGLPFGSVLRLAGKPSQSPGTIDIRADLSGAGDTVRAVAATLGGHAGLAVVDGQIDNDLLESVLRAANIPLEPGGSTTLRCAALRTDAAGGLLQFGALSLDTSKLALDGGGSVNLADETLDMHVRPQLRLGGGLSVPLRVRGTLAAPKVSLDPGAIASGRVGIVLGGAAPPDTCGPALALARDGQAGQAAAAPSPAHPLKPADLLRGLLR